MLALVFWSDPSRELVPRPQVDRAGSLLVEQDRPAMCNKNRDDYYKANRCQRDYRLGSSGPCRTRVIMRLHGISGSATTTMVVNPLLGSLLRAWFHLASGRTSTAYVEVIFSVHVQPSFCRQLTRASISNTELTGFAKKMVTLDPNSTKRQYNVSDSSHMIVWFETDRRVR